MHGGRLFDLVSGAEQKPSSLTRHKAQAAALACGAAGKEGKRGRAGGVLKMIFSNQAMGGGGGRGGGFRVGKVRGTQTVLPKKKIG